MTRAVVPAIDALRRRIVERAAALADLAAELVGKVARLLRNLGHDWTISALFARKSAARPIGEHVTETRPEQDSPR